MKILYLYTEVMGYTLSTVKELINLNYEVHIVNWDKNQQVPMKLKKIEGLTFYPRSEYNYKDIINLGKKISPNMVVVSGWQDLGYLPAAFYFNSKNIPVIAGFDDQWKGSIRQKIAALFSFIIRKFFSHAWVSGLYQFEYAKKFGFKNNQIIYDLYSADINLYNQFYEQKFDQINSYPKRFLFVGRFENVKAMDILLDAWKLIESNRDGWELHFIGNGSLKSKLTQEDGIIVSDFMQPNELVKEIPKTGCFILPSRHEPWGVVIHEFASAGIPLVCSEATGAASTFLINNFNGFIFKNNNSNDLAKKMLKIINSTDKELFEMSKNSYEMGKRISPLSSAMNLLSILD